jgi:hypothetical protein
MDKVDGFRNTSLADWAARVLVPGCQVVLDGLICFAAVGGAGRLHTPINTDGGLPDESALRWVNMLLGNVKNAMHSKYHAIQDNACSAICPSSVIASTEDSIWGTRYAVDPYSNKDTATARQARNLGCVMLEIRNGIARTGTTGRRLPCRNCRPSKRRRGSVAQAPSLSALCARPIARRREESA